MTQIRAAGVDPDEPPGGGGPPRGRWTDVEDDPNDTRNLARRADDLRAAWRPPIADRTAFLQERCRGRSVLDIGCVDHSASRMGSASWLHAALVRVADRCIGVDLVAEGVDAMVREGYTAVVHDLTTGIGPLAAEAPFDVIVAGELIEHLTSLDMLFETAVEVLSPAGELIITTPNPYSPRRVRAGQLGLVWENVDHVFYAFPSGMVELCERHGLRLAEAMVTDDGGASLGLDSARRLKRWAVRRRRAPRGYSTLGDRSRPHVGDREVGPLWRAVLPRRRFLGETFVYVVRRPHSPAGAGGAS